MCPYAITAMRLLSVQLHVNDHGDKTFDTKKIGENYKRRYKYYLKD